VNTRCCANKPRDLALLREQPRDLALLREQAAQTRAAARRTAEGHTDPRTKPREGFARQIISPLGELRMALISPTRYPFRNGCTFVSRVD
jgi:hypothetical protein